MLKISDTERRKHVSFNAFYFEQNHLKHLRNMKDIFQHINDINLWSSPESMSGNGSTAKQTTALKLNLQTLLQRLKIKTLLDAPCGDFGWLGEVELNVQQYIGVDIIESMINNHMQSYKHDSRFKFILSDLTQDVLPTADLILCRDCLVHFSNEAIFQALRNFKKTKCRYLLTTTFIDCKENIDIITGDWRPINLEIAPFNFPKPITKIIEGCTEGNGLYSDKSLGLWEIEKIRFCP